MRDVARDAGVSPATVSKMINGRDFPTDAVRNRILAAITKTGYKKRKTVKVVRNILCVCPSDEAGGNTPHSIQMARVLESSGKKWNFIVSTTFLSGQDSIYSIIRERKIAGVVFMVNDFAHKIPIPAVILNEYVDDSFYPCVDCDDISGLFKIFDFLKECGHRRIAYFCDCRMSGKNSKPRKSRIPGIYERSGIEYSDELLWNEDFKFGEHRPVIRRAVRHFLDLKERPTAIVLAGDIYAPCFYEEMRLNNLRIPEDISIVGFDDFPIADMLHPPLTTVRKPLDAMAEEALRVLYESIESVRTVPGKILLTPELVVRESVKNV